MVFSLLSPKGSYYHAWLASSSENYKKLNKSVLENVSIDSTVNELISEKDKLPINFKIKLLLGLSKLYSKKTEYLLKDSHNALYSFSSENKSEIKRTQPKKPVKRKLTTSSKNKIPSVIDISSINLSSLSNLNDYEKDSQIARSKDITLNSSLNLEEELEKLNESFRENEGDPIIPSESNQKPLEITNKSKSKDSDDVSVEIGRDALLQSNTNTNIFDSLSAGISNLENIDNSNITKINKNSEMQINMSLNFDEDVNKTSGRNGRKIKRKYNIIDKKIVLEYDYNKKKSKKINSKKRSMIKTHETLNKYDLNKLFKPFMIDYSSKIMDMYKGKMKGLVKRNVNQIKGTTPTTENNNSLSIYNSKRIPSMRISETTYDQDESLPFSAYESDEGNLIPLLDEIMKSGKKYIKFSYFIEAIVIRYEVSKKFLELLVICSLSKIKCVQKNKMGEIEIELL